MNVPDKIDLNGKKIASLSLAGDETLEYAYPIQWLGADHKA